MPAATPMSMLVPVPAGPAEPVAFDAPTVLLECSGDVTAFVIAEPVAFDAPTVLSVAH
jgi:hypothetical protein